MCKGFKEEALCSVKSFLLNRGWWVRANNLNIKKMGITMGRLDVYMRQERDDLRRFVMQYKQFVHPNVIKTVNREEEEGYRMALNKIYYGTLKVSRDVQEKLEIKHK